MARYLVRRLGLAVLVLWAAFTVSFVILYLLPGNPVEVMASGGLDQAQISPAQLAALEHQYGFDKPVIVQYFDRLGGVVHGDLGASVQTGQPVGAMIAQALPQTLQLAGAAIVFAVLAGAGVAIAATYTRWSWLRQVLSAVPSLGVSVPTFWVGLMLVQLVSFRWRLLPAFGNDGLADLVLPAITLGLPVAAVIAQVLEKSIRASLAEAYVETARAKGASRARIHFGHVLRNASLPALTVAGVWTGTLLAGSVVVETVFSRDGLGRVTVTAVNYQDIPVVQGVVLVGALAFVTVNLLVDLVYPLLDPRIVTMRGRAVG